MEETSCVEFTKRVDALTRKLFTFGQAISPRDTVRGGFSATRDGSSRREGRMKNNKESRQGHGQRSLPERKAQGRGRKDLSSMKKEESDDIEKNLDTSLVAFFRV